MTSSMVLLGILAFIVIALVSAGVKVVPQSETRVIERLGRFHAVLPPGLNIIWPFIDKPKMVYTRSMVGNYARIVSTSVIDLREQVYDFPSQQVITKDNVTTEINALIYFQIVDPKKSVYEIENLPNAIEKLTQTSLRNVIGELELDETLTSRDTINSKLQAILDEATNKWGVKVNRVELQDITPPESVRVAMEKQMQAERNRRAEILNAEVEKKSLILRSEGERFLFTLCIKDFCTTITLCLHLLFHSYAHTFRRRNILKFDTVNLYTPLVGSFVKDSLQLRVDGVA